MADVLSQLFAFKWRDVEIPISSMRMSIAHDLVEHKYWGVDGSRIEATGLEAIRIHAKIPLQNSVYPGTNERWEGGNAYSILRPLIVSFTKRESGLLQLPEFGSIVCKAEKLDIDWDAMRRGGCDAEASWIENHDDNLLPDVKDSPVQAMADAARDMDATDDIKYLVPDLPVYADSFESLMNKATGLIDRTTHAIGAPERLLNRVTYRAQQMEDAVERARTSLAWSVVHNAERIKAAANDIRKQLGEVNRAIGLFRVPAETTLAGVAMQIEDSSLVDIIRLNPKLMNEPNVPAGTIVRYFGAKQAA